MSGRERLFFAVHGSVRYVTTHSCTRHLANQSNADAVHECPCDVTMTLRRCVHNRRSATWCCTLAQVTQYEPDYTLKPTYATLSPATLTGLLSTAPDLLCFKQSHVTVDNLVVPYICTKTVNASWHHMNLVHARCRLMPTVLRHHMHSTPSSHQSVCYAVPTSQITRQPTCFPITLRLR